MGVRYCKNCDKRTADCHAKCFAYNVEHARLKLLKEKREAERRKHLDYVAYVCDGDTALLRKGVSGKR